MILTLRLHNPFAQKVLPSRAHNSTHYVSFFLSVLFPLISCIGFIDRMRICTCYRTRLNSRNLLFFSFFETFMVSAVISALLVCAVLAVQ